MSDPPDPKVVPLEQIRKDLEAAEPVQARRLPECGKFKDLPEGSPVTPLGRGEDARVRYFLTPRGQVMALESGKTGQEMIDTLFSPEFEFLYEHWPRYGKDNTITGVRYENVRKALERACDRLPIWNPKDKVRGPGGWRGAGERLVLHCGDAVYGFGGPGWADRKRAEPGVLDHRIYVAGAAQLRPEAGPCPPAAVAPLLEALGGWNWRNQVLEPRLVVGWMAAAVLGAALDWRPLWWNVGPAGTGKSALREFIAGVFGVDGAVSSGNATPAYIRSQVKASSLPVLLDEAEPEDERYMRQLVLLARLAASGDTMGRSNPSHEGMQFALRMAMGFASIRIPPLDPAMWSRIIVTQLEPLTAESRLPDMRPEALAALGRVLRRRVVDVWGRLAEAERVYDAALADVGHSRRGQAVLGTTLALARLVLEDQVPSAKMARVEAAAVAPRMLVEWLEPVAEQRRVIDHILSRSLVVSPSLKETVARLAAQAAGWRGIDYCHKTAARVLAGHGLKVEREKLPQNAHRMLLLLGRGHGGLQELVRGTLWEGPPGKTSVLLQDLEGLAVQLGGQRTTDKPRTIGGISTRCLALPLEKLIDREAQGEDAEKHVDIAPLERGPLEDRFGMPGE